jgi:sensor domain CHASE-containing protein
MNQQYMFAILVIILVVSLVFNLYTGIEQERQRQSILRQLDKLRKDIVNHQLEILETTRDYILMQPDTEENRRYLADILNQKERILTIKNELGA